MSKRSSGPPRRRKLPEAKRGPDPRAGRRLPGSGRFDPGRFARTRSRPVPPIETILESQDWDSLIPHLERAQAEKPARVVQLLRDYARLLLEWNRSVSNLISTHDETRILERHLLESIEPAYWLKESGGSLWMDFGAGAGLPGIPLAISGVGSRWILIESRRPKVLFVRKTLETLGLHHIDVEHTRLESWLVEGKSPRMVNGFVSRATLRLQPTLELAEQVVLQGGAAFLWKGSRRHEETGDGTSWQRAFDLVGEMELGSGPTSVLKFVRR